ncbi:hypothetical protein VQ03_28365 [Methylobacterium tarhaniae]|uniref:Uncharacterized protein n=1 Tax=Methylobacterium tarhaniae TaxID=1187852 RepID=A0A0J6SA81_9HYPH|nr:hypothetical protein VQ03_28365 [Methylobacterium tarhaniae]
MPAVTSRMACQILKDLRELLAADPSLVLDVFDGPHHPYTASLLDAVPSGVADTTHTRHERSRTVAGEPLVS